MKPKKEKPKRGVNQLTSPIRHKIPFCLLDVSRPIFDDMRLFAGTRVKYSERKSSENWKLMRQLLSVGFSEVSVCLRRKQGLNVVLIEASLQCYPLIQVLASGCAAQGTPLLMVEGLHHFLQSVFGAPRHTCMAFKLVSSEDFDSENITSEEKGLTETIINCGNTFRSLAHECDISTSERHTELQSTNETSSLSLGGDKHVEIPQITRTPNYVKGSVVKMKSKQDKLLKSI